MSTQTGITSAGAAGKAPEGQAGQDAGGAQDKAREAAGQAQQKAQQAAGQAKGRVREQVDQRSTQAGEQVQNAAQDARSVAEELRNKGKEQPAKYAEQAADRVERLGSYLKQSDADRILGDVEDFARRQPMAVLAGGLALGLAASRFLKASSAKRYRSSASGGHGHPGAGQYAPPTPATLERDPLTPVATPPRGQAAGVTPEVSRALLPDYDPGPAAERP